jgi:hypothetical protein
LIPAIADAVYEKIKEKTKAEQLEENRMPVEVINDSSPPPLHFDNAIVKNDENDIFGKITISLPLENTFF